MRRVVVIALLAVVLRPAAAGACLVEELERVGRLVVVHEYREAEDRLDSLEAAYPDSSQVAMQQVILYYTWMDDFGIVDSLGPLFGESVDRTLELAERTLHEHQDNAMAHFARGSALMYRTIFRAYTEGVGVGNAPSLVRDARDGIEAMELALRYSPKFHDPMVGIGKYRYWKYDRLPWPFSSDRDRREGIRLLEDAVRLGVTSEPAAIQTLGWTYVSEGRFDDARELVEPLIARYPGSRFFREIRARALLYDGNWSEARKEYEEIRALLEEAGRERPYLRMKYGRRLAQIDGKTGRHYEACVRAQRLRRLNYDGVHETWLSRRMRPLTEIMQESCPRATREGRR